MRLLGVLFMSMCVVVPAHALEISGSCEFSHWVPGTFRDPGVGAYYDVFVTIDGTPEEATEISALSVKMEGFAPPQRVSDWEGVEGTAPLEVIHQSYVGQTIIWAAPVELPTTVWVQILSPIPLQGQVGTELKLTAHLRRGFGGEEVLPAVTTPIVALFTDDLHSADTDANHAISMSELLRVIQLFTLNYGKISCDDQSEDGYRSGSGGGQSCQPHSADMDHSWHIDLNELLRVIQVFRYHYYACPQADTEDGFCLYN